MKTRIAPFRLTPLMVRRLAARLADLAVMVILAAVLPGAVGALAAFAYALVSDALERLPWNRLPPAEFWRRMTERIARHPGQSVGKVLMQIRVIQVRGAQALEPLTLKESVIRNLPFGIMTFFLFIPLWGWLLAFLVGIPLIALETYLMIRVPRGQRLGDALANTEVVGLIV